MKPIAEIGDVSFGFEQLELWKKKQRDIRKTGCT
jgi:hypothetical protein